MGTVPSTMAEARARAAAGAPEGTTVVAEAQTAGRGRRGRVWVAPPGGGVWMTTVLRPPPGPGLQALALVAGVAVWRAVRALAPHAPARVKWPNDVWVGGRKLAGILLEADEVTGPQPVVLLGVGVNLRPAAELQLPPEVARHSVGLAELQRPAEAADPPNERRDRDGCTAQQALAVLLPALQAGYADWCQHGLAAVLRAWPKADALAGAAVSAEGAAGPLYGVAEGLGPHGELRLRFASGDLGLIHAGEVQTLRPIEDFHEEPPPTQRV